MIEVGVPLLCKHSLIVKIQSEKKTVYGSKQLNFCSLYLCRIRNLMVEWDKVLVKNSVSMEKSQLTPKFYERGIQFLLYNLADDMHELLYPNLNQIHAFICM